MPKFLSALAVLMPTVILAQAPHRSGSLQTPEVDLGYEVLGAPSAEIPLFAVNGGPGLSHAYMMQNDLWQRVAAHRLVVLYDQCGTGASKHVRPHAPQSMDAQVADLEAIRNALSLDRIAGLGGFLRWDDCHGLRRSSSGTCVPPHPLRFPCALLEDHGSSAAPGVPGSRRTG